MDFAFLLIISSEMISDIQVAILLQRPIPQFSRIDDPAWSFPNLLAGADPADMVQIRAALKNPRRHNIYLWCCILRTETRPMCQRELQR